MQAHWPHTHQQKYPSTNYSERHPSTHHWGLYTPVTGPQVFKWSMLCTTHDDQAAPQLRSWKFKRGTSSLFWTVHSKQLQFPVLFSKMLPAWIRLIAALKSPSTDGLSHTHRKRQCFLRNKCYPSLDTILHGILLYIYSRFTPLSLYSSAAAEALFSVHLALFTRLWPAQRPKIDKV